ncbi:hypothetical protein GH742_03870 [Legionella sp. MW5194]|uniref:hypothetical protein n=1 Tax=Legionella sp. MW5194 TaxID=2662448 RepID=UPI00193DB81F|nr:hypothetical protein [Legionella sp. MW5194]QRN03068.1 hypothetical protein GH742_03870 [Legionella sp. MW5194]
MTTTLLVTILCELAAFLLIIKRLVPQKEFWLWMAFIIGLNCVTNPLAQIAFHHLEQATHAPNLSWVVTEAVVILVEALLIRIAMLKPLKSGLGYSLILNGSSIIIGELLCWLKLLPACA